MSYGHGTPKDTFVLHDGKLSAFPADPMGLLRLDFLDARDKLALFRFFAALGKVEPSGLATTSVQEWLERKIRRPRLRLLMTAVARTFSYTTALDLVSAELFVEKLQRSLKHPVHYIDGGWQVLVRRQYLPRIESVGALPTAESGGFAGRPDSLVPGSTAST